MKPQLFILLAFVVFLIWGCNKKAQNEKESPTATSSMEINSGAKSEIPVKKPVSQKCRVDKYMRFPILKYQSEKEKECKTDSDCIVSSMVPGNCCNHGCNQRWIYTRAYLERSRKYKEEWCKGIKLNCKQYRCPQNRVVNSGKCKNRRCKMVSKPAPWTLKKKPL
jgi:hypothetical protein